jgi:pyridoxal phosphate enzyme (YggS family)
MINKSIINLNNIKKSINSLNLKNFSPEIIAVSKTFKIEDIAPLIEHGHIHFGENKVQEAFSKWTEIKIANKKIKLHMIGKLQTNKVKMAVQLFDFIHSIDSIKLVKKIAEEQKRTNKLIKLFIQVNIGNEDQKSGVRKEDLNQLISYCKNTNLYLCGLMCIPPAGEDPSVFFKEISALNKNFGFKDLSMGMSSDYLKACEFQSTYLRIGSGIFGYRN